MISAFLCDVKNIGAIVALLTFAVIPLNITIEKILNISHIKEHYIWSETISYVILLTVVLGIIVFAISSCIIS